MKLLFNDSINFIQLDSYIIYPNRIYVSGNGITENFSGFMIYDDEEKNIIYDGMNYIYKWNIYTEYENGIIFTSSEIDREQEPIISTEEPIEIMDPLSNEELTECVADLMYEQSLTKLGLEDYYGV